MQFSLEFPEVLAQNLVCYNGLGVSGNSKIMHCGILIYMPFCNTDRYEYVSSYKKSSNTALNEHFYYT